MRSSIIARVRRLFHELCPISEQTKAVSRAEDGTFTTMARRSSESKCPASELRQSSSFDLHRRGFSGKLE